jgi:hypothetical protein
VPYPGPYRLALTHLLVWYFDLGLVVECEGPGEDLVVETGETGPVVVVEARW